MRHDPATDLISVAIVPFGARSGDARAGAWGRQIARRLVDRFAGHPRIEAKPVFLVAMPETASGPGYLVFGSTPDEDLAAQYGASLGATHTLVGQVRAEGGERAIEARLVDVTAKVRVAEFERIFPDGSLHEAEPALAKWLASSLGVEATPATAAAANEAAYLALLEAMDEEVNATLLRTGDPERAATADERAIARYLDALRADPACTAAEERLLVLAAGSLERGDEPRYIGALERLIELVPRAWRAHYLLAELRHAAGEVPGAIVAYEHADAVRPLSDADAVRLAQLYVEADAAAAAAARLRRIRPDSAAYARAQDLLGVIAVSRRELGEAVAAFERAIAAGAFDGATHAHLAEGLHARGDVTAAIARYREALARGAPPPTRLNLARALVSAGDTDAAATELDALLANVSVGELAAQARRLRVGLRRHDLETRLERGGRVAVGGDDADLRSARTDLEAVVAEEPELWEAHFGLALIARRSGDAAAAERALRRVLELWPDQPDALHELGVALLMSARTAEALSLLDTAARLRPEDPGYVADAGFAQLRAGNLEAARARLALASELDADDPITQAYVQELTRVEGASRPN